MKPAFIPGNRVSLLESGTEYFPALARAIEQAQEEIHLETYIFEADATGRLIATALAAAARRGVAVRVMVDGFGARDFYPALGESLTAAGAHVLIYRQELAALRLRRNRLRRLHRKLAVIDGRLGFIGGINVIDDMDTPHQTPPRYDYAVEVEGPVVADMHRAVHRLWQLMSWATFHRRSDPALLNESRPLPCGDVLAALVIRDNVGHRRDIEEAYLAAIHDARSEVTIACAYFLPGQRFLAALAAAAARGVAVTILLQGRVEYLLLHHATQSLYDRLLNSGIRIFEYHRSFLHAKVGLVDRRWVTVGSSNIDPFSLLLAREANLVVLDADVANRLHTSLQQAMHLGAAEVLPGDLKRRSMVGRLLNRLSYTLVRVAIALTRYGGDDYRE